MVNVLRIHPADDVVMATSYLPAGTTLDLGDGAEKLGIQTLEPIPFGHKVAIRPINKGQTIIKYGASIGVATQAIQPGQHVHSHNLATVRGAIKQ